MSTPEKHQPVTMKLVCIAAKIVGDVFTDVQWVLLFYIFINVIVILYGYFHVFLHTELWDSPQEERRDRADDIR